MSISYSFYILFQFHVKISSLYFVDFYIVVSFFCQILIPFVSCFSIMLKFLYPYFIFCQFLILSLYCFSIMLKLISYIILIFILLFQFLLFFYFFRSLLLLSLILILHLNVLVDLNLILSHLNYIMKF
jgi:hypothetical protein